MNQSTLSTAEFAAAIGVSESSVRRLADTGQLHVQRTRGGHRRIPTSEAIRYVRAHQITVARPDLLGLLNGDPISDGKSASDRLLAALNAGHARSVIGSLQTMYANGMSIATICDGPIHNALQAIGDRWPRDKKAIFIEHRATLLCVRALCQIRMAMREPDQGAMTAIGCAPTDDPYLLPSLMVSLVLHDCGFNETNLGPNTPLDVVIDSVDDEQPKLVWVAITNPIRSRTHHRELENLIKAVNAYDGVVVIGGQGAATYEGDGTVRCSSMTELEELAHQLAPRQ